VKFDDLLTHNSRLQLSIASSQSHYIIITMLTFKFASAALAALVLMPATATATALTDSTCNSAANQKSCFQLKDDETGSPCQWCVAGAIPSECLSANQAEQVPAAVFECSAPGFDFVEGKRHSLQVKEGDDDFCDSSSTGRSGYMDIKGSDYDANGENKHLFFWMYEKRGEVADDTPFMVWLTGGPGCSSVR
jgi:carboxypeptidase C (cathepsin A)